MKIVIPGGSGQVGTILSRAFRAAGHDVVVLSRKPVAGECRAVAWDGKSLGPWAAELDGANAVINLAGRSVNCRYTPRNRRAIMDSRVESTRIVGKAIAQANRPPRVWLQASTATIYAHRYDAANDEASGILGGTEPNAPDTWRFSIDVATAWERAAMESNVLTLNGPKSNGPRSNDSESNVPVSNTPVSNTNGTRQVLMRSAVTLSPDRGGIFDVLLGLVRRGLGGRNADGRQYVSWIHDRDFIRAVFWLIDHDELDGPVNIAAPHPLPNEEFLRTLRAAWGTRIGLPASRWMLELGTFLLRTETELVLKSRRVVPARLLESGFRFEFPEWPAAARDLCRRWRKGADRNTSAHGRP